MKIYYNKSDALQAKKENEIIISEQQPSTVYYYYTVEFDELLRLLNKMKKTPFYFHEMMDPTTPVKFYIDYERDDLTSEDQHLVCALELQEIIDTISKSFLPYKAEYLLLEARDPTRKKFSAHAKFFNVWCENMYSIKQHLMKLGLGDKLDLSIYSESTEKSLRLAFADKRGEKRPMLPIVNGKPIPYFHPSLFAKALNSVTSSKSTSFKHLLPEEPTEFIVKYDPTYECEELNHSKSKTKRIRLLPMTEEETHMEEIVNKIIDWIQDFRYDVKIEIEQIEATSAALYIRGKTKCRGGLFCSNAGRVHKRNHTRMHITRIGKHGLRTRIRCLDEKCWHLLQTWPVDFSNFCPEIPSIIKF